ncbi:alpha/beta fold hydrolase [Aggregatibacter actinomycetemcomitans]|uniref:alpha/beta fold hydrolase n=1 Tax=Aggregatibacter actinomycetemcomitans TaxID=714 RepID=UPI0011D40795|nr:alpha/beta fold hydrolase [Aggregatibacter actinomycetemcomitans]TYA37629.1 alpha/beta fold hydrolase [Aggregatibacter actinomycetemcomitans]TYB23355.1 alpha/beta fold hydrolase [Aggregatibacter actinomycetemcomitans]
MQKLLKFQFNELKQAINKPTLVFIHGLFGDMNNLGIIARAFSEDYAILRVDLRNHGASFHSEEMNYDLMSEDVFHVIQSLSLREVILVGHSMGGKTAMVLAANSPDLVKGLVVIDIAPIAYGEHGHDAVFNGLFAVKNTQPHTRQEAKPILAQHIYDESVQQFMLKSFDATSVDYFRFNLTALKRNYPNLMGWQTRHIQQPCLFIKGGNSSYILPEYADRILAQCPQASSFTINGSDHWVHAEKPQFVIRAITNFLNKINSEYKSK